MHRINAHSFSVVSNLADEELEESLNAALLLAGKR